MTYYIGIDPGAKGAIAVISHRMRVVTLEDYPANEIELAKIYRRELTPDRDYLACIEKAHAMPKQGVKSMFSYGGNFNQWKMGLAMLEIPFREITPQAWMKGLIPKGADKQRHVDEAQRLFPQVELYGKMGGKKDGRADALLIAYYCKNNFE